ncbi:hypothetical protein [Agrobacterium pusense]|uniref:hypothetical protein n=1 Tax=Agrobacterium pusense TaxID=648995 RepID=UPI000D38BF31|nr:hypothetical protein [Agrobacterium pusense]PTV70173.1 hypothetical protein DBL06_25250 [Agrobacterium pusense]
MSMKDPAFSTALQLGAPSMGVASVFQGAMDKLMEMPKHDGRYSQREVQGIVDTADALGEALKEMMEEFLMAHNREESHLVQIAGLEHRVETLKALLAAEEAKVAQLEADLDDAEGGSSAVRISIPKAG